MTRKEQAKDILIRATKTFFQTFISILIAQISGLSIIDGTDVKKVLINILLSSISGGISAVWNGILKLTEKTEETEK